MPLIRINALNDRPVLHQNPNAADLGREIARRDPAGSGPVIIMIHGLKYAPGHPRACPHRSLFSSAPQARAAWPRHLGFGLIDEDEGLGIAFGWPARGGLHRAMHTARIAGRALAGLIGQIKALWPGRPVHLLSHSLGSEVAFEALHHLPSGAVGRMILMTAASFQARAQAAMQSPAGRSTEVINITSRENDLFDFLLEQLAGWGTGGARTVSHGIAAPQAVTLQLDCPDTLAHLARLGRPLPGAERRVCHWSSYTRSGTLRLYAGLLREPARFPLALLRAGVPERPAPRWSRLYDPALLERCVSSLTRRPRDRSYSAEAPRSATT